MSSIDLIIPAAGRRKGGPEPRPFVSLGAETVIGRQLRLAKTFFSPAKNIVVVGFSAVEFSRRLPLSTHLVLNKNWRHTNMAYSTALGLERSTAERSLVIHGDMVFARELLGSLPGKGSFVVVAKQPDPPPGRPRKKPRRPDEVGVSVQDGEATRFAYGLTPKWAHVLCLTAGDRREFVKLAMERTRSHHFTHEILNELIEWGSVIQAVPAPEEWLAEIDGPDHVKDAIKIASLDID